MRQVRLKYNLKKILLEEDELDLVNMESLAPYSSESGQSFNHPYVRETMKNFNVAPRSNLGLWFTDILDSQAMEFIEPKSKKAYYQNWSSKDNPETHFGPDWKFLNDNEIDTLYTMMNSYIDNWNDWSEKYPHKANSPKYPSVPSGEPDTAALPGFYHPIGWDHDADALTDDEAITISDDWIGGDMRAPSGWHYED